MKGAWREPEALFLPDQSATLESLRAAAETLIEGFPQHLTLPKVEVRKTITLEEMVENLSKRVTTR
jgi:hypothetical protein